MMAGMMYPGGSSGFREGPYPFQPQLGGGGPMPAAQPAGQSAGQPAFGQQPGMPPGLLQMFQQMLMQQGGQQGQGQGGQPFGGGAGMGPNPAGGPSGFGSQYGNVDAQGRFGSGMSPQLMQMFQMAMGRMQPPGGMQMGPGGGQDGSQMPRFQPSPGPWGGGQMPGTGGGDPAMQPDQVPNFRGQAQPSQGAGSWMNSLFPGGGPGLNPGMGRSSGPVSANAYGQWPSMGNASGVSWQP